MKVKAESKCISCLCQKCKNKRDFFGERYCACKKFREKFGGCSDSMYISECDEFEADNKE